MATSKFSQSQQSQTIDFMRFPLIVGVVFIHSTQTAIQIDGVVYGASVADLPFMYYCSNLFSNVIARIAVPLFFFISGFLYFFNVYKFAGQAYKNKLYSRMSTLLVPYIFWNFIVFAVYYIMQNVSFLNGFTNKSLDLHNFMSYFWSNPGEMQEGYFDVTAIKNLKMPIAYQFWFIRDLMIAVLLVPIIYFFCKKTKIYGILIVGILWFFQWWFNFVGFSPACFFFFTVGAYFGMNKRNLLNDFEKLKMISFILYPLIVVIDLCTKKYNFNHFIHDIGIIVGIIFFFNLVAYLFEKEIIKPVKFLSAASFFLFATHDQFLLKPLRKISYVIFRPKSDLSITSLYFINVFLTVLIALGIYYVLNRYFSKFTKIICGGR